jgi:antirestriction protein ArdC
MCSTPTRSTACYATLAHETVHWAGHGSRCACELKGKFGSETYAAEELVAELGAAFLCADLALASEPRPDHAAYVASWLKVLKGDKRAIVTSSALAQKAFEAGRAVRAMARCSKLRGRGAVEASVHRSQDPLPCCAGDHWHSLEKAMQSDQNTFHLNP